VGKTKAPRKHRGAFLLSEFSALCLLAADLPHRARRGLISGTKVVLRPFHISGGLNDLRQLGDRSAAAQRAPDIDFVIVQQTGTQFAV